MTQQPKPLMFTDIIELETDAGKKAAADLRQMIASVDELLDQKQQEPQKN